MKKRYLFRSLALMVLMIVINQGNAWALMLANPSVSYLDEEGVTQTITEYTLIYGDQTTAQTWTSGYYVVGADYNGDGVINGDDATYAKERSFATTFSFSNTVTLSEHAQVTLIIADGFSLSVSSKDAEAGQSATAAINEANTFAEMYLTVTAQSLGDDAGKLSVTGGKGGAGNASAGMKGGAGASLTKLIVNAGNVTITGGQGGQGGIYDDQGKDGGEGGTALTANNLIVNNGTLILHGGKGGEGGNGDEGQGKTGVTKMGAMIISQQPAIKNGVLIADGGATTGAFMTFNGAITDGTNPVTMYDLDGNALSYQNSTGMYKYDGAIATHLSNITPFDLVSVSSLGQQGGGVTFTVDGTTATKAWAGMTVTVAGVAVEGYYVAGLTSDQVTITDNTFVMPETAVTVTATYGKYDDRIVVGGTSGEPSPYTLTSGKTYTAKTYAGRGGAVYVDNGGTLNTNGASFDGNAITGDMNDGGAICNNYGTVNVSGGSFTSNSTVHDGGAIFNKGGTTNISGTDFTDNYTKVSGGAIGSSNGGTLDITASTFTGNTATTGGAIHTNCGSSGCVAILTDVAFYSNTSTGTESYEGGGAIMNFRGSVMTLSNVTFSGNTAAKVGGAIYNYSEGTINLTGLVDLQTATDTWVNEGYYMNYNHTEVNSIVNWNLTSVTDPAQSKVCIKGFQWYSNLTTTYTEGTEVTKVLVNQNITVKAEGAQAEGQYVIATGDFNLTTLQTNNSTDFTVTDGTNNVNITVNGTAGIIGNQGYKLTIVESTEAGADQLVLTVFNYDKRQEVSGTLTLESGKTYTAAPYEGNGGAVNVINGGTLNTNGASFDGNSVTESQNDGGAIFNKGTVNVSGGSFTGNSATHHDGGAICNYGGKIDITSATFSGNTAAELGGAIHNQKGTLDITSATFTGNTAKEGGAIFCRTENDQPWGAATLTDVAFYGNASTSTYPNEGGGAIENSRGCVMNLSGITFSGNTAANKGGAIYNYCDGTINLTGSVDLQTATDTWVNEGFYNSYYGIEENAVVNWDLTGVTDPAQSKVCIKGFQWYSNLTTTYNAGTEVTKVLVNQNITVKAEGAQAEGQYVIATGDFNLTTLQTNNSTDFTVTDGTNNVNITVNGDAAVIGNQGYKLALVESTEAGADQLVLTVINYDKRQEVSGTLTLESGNTYTAAPHAGQGGAAYVGEDATLTGKDVTFADNTVTDSSNGRGGAIYACTTAVISLDGDIVFSGNKAKRTGGAICGNGDSGAHVGATIKFTGNSVRFINNTAENVDAGAINLSLYNTLTVESSAEFSGNSAGNEGGAIWSGGATTIFNGTVDFCNNTAGTNGGAICGYFYTVNNIVTLNNTATFTGNSATGNGGAIYNDGGTVTINGETTFSANTATTNGGAIYNTGTVNINSKTTFSANTATLGGGAIYNTGTVNMADSVILETSADKIYNKGTLNWNLTGTKTGKLINYQYLTNDAGNGGKLTITVKDSDKEGDSYVIATGNMSNLTGKDTFTLTGVDGQADVNLTVNGGIGIYNGQGYKLTTTGSGDNGKLVLSVVHDYTLVLKEGIAYKSTDNGSTLGETITLDGLTFADGIWTMKDFTFETSAATAVNVQGSSAVTTTVTGDNVITGGDSDTENTNGLLAKRPLTLQGSGTLTVTAGNSAAAEGISHGLMASGCNLTIKEITLNASAGDGYVSRGINAAETTIADAIVTANSGNGSEGSNGLAAVFSIEVSGSARITATAIGSNAKAVAISMMGEPNAGAQWNGTVLTWDSTNGTYKSGSDIATTAILTKKLDQRIYNSGVKTLGEEGSQTIFTAVAYNGNDDGAAIQNYAMFTATNVTFANNEHLNAAKNGGAIYNTASVNLNGKTTFTGNKAASGKGGAIYNKGTVNMTDSVILATSTDSIYNNNNGTLNWDLTGGKESYGCIVNYQYVENAGGTLKLKVAAKQQGGEYVIATGDMTGYETDATGKYAFTLTDGGSNTQTIKVGNSEILFLGYKYSLAVNGDKLVLTVVPPYSIDIDPEFEGKWFKKGEAITITGTATTGGDMTQIKFSGYGADATTTITEDAWSCTLPYAGETKGTTLTLTGLNATNTPVDCSVTYTLKVDTVAPAALFKFTDSRYTNEEYKEQVIAKAGSLTFDIQLTDTTSGGICNVSAELDGAAWAATNYNFDGETGKLTTTEAAFTGLLGKHKFAVKAFDAAGNDMRQEIEITFGVCRNINTDEYYATLDEAIAEVKTGETIELLTDVEMKNSVEMPSGTYLDLKGFTLTDPQGLDLKWDLTDDNNPVVKDFDKLNAQGTLTLNVNDLQTRKDYVIAKDAANATGREFTLPGGDMTYDHQVRKVAVGGEPVFYGHRHYSLKLNSNNEIVLTVTKVTPKNGEFWGVSVDGSTLDLANAQNFNVGLSKAEYVAKDNITSFVFNGPITRVGVAALKDNLQLKEIYFPASVEIIAQDAVRGCENLEYASMLDVQATAIGPNAFENDKQLTLVEWPEQLAEINAFAFAYCDKLEEITLPKTLKSIYGNAFSYSKNLKEVTLQAESMDRLWLESFEKCHEDLAIYVPYMSLIDYEAISAAKGLNFQTRIPVMNNGSDKASVYCHHNMTIPAGVTFQTMKQNGSTQAVAGGIAPGGAGYIVEFDPGVDAVEIVTTAEQATSINENVLRGVLKDTPVGNIITNEELYIAATESMALSSDVVSAYSAFYVKKNGAILKFDYDEATGVLNVNADADADGATFNTAGQQINEQYKGIVIKNGKKYLNK